MKNSLKLILSLAGLTLLASPVLRAEDPVTPPAGKPEHRARREEMRENMQEMAKELDLTAEQQAKTKVIREQTAEALKAIHQDAALSDEQKRAKAKELRKSTEDQVHALLTPEQQVKAKEMRAKHKPKGEKAHGGKPKGDKPQGEKPAGN